MRPLRDQLLFYASNQIRNLSIILGVILSFCIVFSFLSEEASLESNSMELAIQIDDLSTAGVNAREQAVLMETSSTKYHNFLASYFMQESSRERKSKTPEEKGEIINNLRDLKSIIASGGLSLF
jgi:ATP phosphoribosyltransferase regulatory subunit HisZ